MEEEKDNTNITIEKDSVNKKDLTNIFDISSIGQSFINEEEILNKLQRDISEYTNYDNIQNPYNFKSWWDTLSSSKEAPFQLEEKSIKFPLITYQVLINYGIII